MKIILTFVPPLNSFILNEAECEGLPEGAQVTVKTRCQGAGIAPTGIIIDIPGRGDLDAMAALLDEANLKIETYKEQIGEFTASSVELEAEIEELKKKLVPDADTATKPYEEAGPEQTAGRVYNAVDHAPTKPGKAGKK
jgi:hypothetical protein